MSFEKPSTTYWNNKFTAYMHDPLDKVFKIRGHEERAAHFLELYGLSPTNDEFWKKADGIAAGFERGQVPSYSSDDNKNGAVDFLETPVITHPTSQKEQLKIILPNYGSDAFQAISDALLTFMECEIGMCAGKGGYSDKFKGDEDRFSIARFFYTHLVLRFKLAEENISELGAFWHRVPADSRFPDHSIWQHNALCSALSSCIELAGDVSQVGMMVFSITPVQQFIAKARKLRDYWVGSMLLSWLSFEGMRWVMENLGPDHILYPSLIDQPLVNQYMKKHWKVDDDGYLSPPKDIASFPNKFLFLIPMNHAEAIGDEIKKHIRGKWKDLHSMVCDQCNKMVDSDFSNEERKYVKEIFDRQNEHFWDLQWSASHLVSNDDKDEIAQLLPETIYKSPFELLARFNDIIKEHEHYDKSGRGVLYSVSHSLAQSTLAASKNKKQIMRGHENGEKCHMCGQFEVVHHLKHRDNSSANEYKKGIELFWDTLKRRWDGDENNIRSYNLNASEKLCSICLVKRMICEMLRNNKEHFLYDSLKDDESFPSTTEIALYSYFQKEERKGKRLSEKAKRAKAQNIHDQADETDNRDRYFSILLMDGDKMGQLVNGETLASTWDSVMHPEIVKRLKASNFDDKYRKNWEVLFNKKRLVTPAIHAAISESLGDFALYGVARIVKKYEGRLIYAGGDDVCAVLPVETSLKAAREIREYYISTYKHIQKDQDPEPISEQFKTASGKLSINLGKGENISISAAILICHHKESLSQMIVATQCLLKDKAKSEAGRNACAIELRKRSGGSRYFIRKWDESSWDSFLKIGNAVKSENGALVSSSVIYRLEKLRSGVEAILEHTERWNEMLVKLIGKQLERSDVGKDADKDILARQIVDLVVVKHADNRLEYKPESLIVAAFMSQGGE